MTPAGRRDKRVRFRREVAAASGFNNDTPTWADVPDGQRWALVLYGSGAERRAAAAEQASQTATVRVLADSVTRTIRARDRIAFDAMDWDIIGVAPIGRYEIEFTATAAARE